MTTPPSPPPGTADPWPVALGKFVLPFALFAGLFLLAYLLWPEGDRYQTAWFWMLALFLTPLGKFTAIGMQSAGFHAVTTIFFLGSIEFCFALFFVLNFDLLYRVPRVGAWVHKAEEAGRRRLLKKAWVQRLAFVGIILWTSVPFQGTGAITGAVFGRLMGMGRLRTFLAIILGGYGGLTAVVLGNLGIRSAYQAGIDWGIYSTVLIATLLYILWAGYWSPYRPAEDAEPDDVRSSV